MYYFIAAKDFLIKFDVFVLPIAFLLVWVFGIINFSKNTYCKQNKKINACRIKLLKNSSQPSVVMKDAPEEYRRQWRAFVSSGAEKPSQTFEFVAHRNRKVGVTLVVLGALVSTAYLAIFVTDMSRRDYLVFQLAFWLAFAVVMVVNMLIFRRKEKRARQTFGKLVAQLNAVVAKGGREVVAEQPQKQTVAEKINSVKKKSVGKEALQEASKILRQSGLNATRTAHEQRQINYALNGLLQSYSRQP